MTNEQRKVDLALAVLRRCFQDLKQPEQGPALKLALRVLLPYAGRHHLMAFWSVTANENPLQRINDLRRIYECIEAVAARRVRGR